MRGLGLGTAGLTEVLLPCRQGSLALLGSFGGDSGHLAVWLGWVPLCGGHTLKWVGPPPPC